MIDFDKLKAPFPPEAISWRVGSTNKDKSRGMALAYIDARDVMQRLDEVCGVAGWQCRYPHANGKTICEIGIKIGDEWIWKADGAGDSDIEAEKGAISDAFKRSAVKWGIGRYLYDLDSPWVELDQYKRIKDSELPRLRRLLAGDQAVPATQAPKREARPSEPSTDKKIADTLIFAITQAETSADLDEWVNAEDTKRTIADLEENHRARVREAFTRRKVALKQPLLAAG